MAKSVFLALILGYTTSAVMDERKLPFYNPDGCGRLTTFNSFVMTDLANNVTGHITHDAPWAVHIHIDQGKDHPAILCGGTMITSKHVITAAHCFRKKTYSDKTTRKTRSIGFSVFADKYCTTDCRLSDSHILSHTKVTVGSVCLKMIDSLGCTHREMLGKRMSISRFAFGGFFKGHCENGNDIAILELNDSVENVEAFNHVCLPFMHNLQVPEEVTVTSYGWGADPEKAYDNEPYPLLQILNLETITTDECSEIWGADVPADSICTREEEDKNMCSGDSGGGLTYEDEKTKQQNLLGIISYGTDCRKLLLGTAPKSQINTLVAKHEKFIRDFINNK